MSARPSRTSRARIHLAAALRTGVGWGFPLGATLGGALTLLPTSSFALPTPGARLAIVAFLASLMPLLCTLSLLPVAASAVLIERALTGRRLATSSLYRAALGGGFAGLVLFFWLAFNGLRNPRAPFSLAVYGSIGVAWLLAVAIAAARDREITRTARTVPWLASLVACAAIAAGSGMLLTRHPQLTGSATGLPEAVPYGPNGGEPGGDGGPPPYAAIVVSIDTLRADHLGAYGYGGGTTPHLDQLASRGVVFTRARSQAPWTLPSHATMFTSLYPVSHGARISSLHAPVIDRLEDHHRTLAEVAAAAGMDTASFVSTPWLGEKWGLQRGFHETHVADPRALSSREIVDRAIAWIGDRKQRPFFLFLHFFDVHNYTSPPGYESRRVDPAYAGPLRDAELLTSRNVYEHLDPADIAYLVARYDAALRWVDDELGRLFRWLEANGESDRTLLLVTSDHGEEFWDHGGTGHGFTLYEEMLRVPLILRLPGPLAGRRGSLDGNVGVIDVMPTLLDYLGIEPPPGLEGVSLRPMVEGQPPPPRPLFAEDTYFLNSYAVMHEDLKYLENSVPPPALLNPRMLFVNLRSFYKFRPAELYGVVEDPREQRNLARERPGDARRLRDDLLGHIRLAEDGTRAAIDDETLERLRSLGYVR